MYIKYNLVLRGLQLGFKREDMVNLCKGNTYATTLHAINSAIVKLSKLTMATKVYRGVSGGILPEEARKPDSFGVRGGVEAAFMSTSMDLKAALFYARGGAQGQTGEGVRPGIVFEFQQGLVNRGADVSWLSQFPGEKEILFAPLTGMSMHA